MATLVSSCPLLPLLWPAVTAFVLLLLSDVPTPAGVARLAGPSAHRAHLLVLTLVALLGTAAVLLLAGPTGTGGANGSSVRALSTAIAYDGLTLVAGTGLCLSAAVAAVLAYAALVAQGAAVAEYLALLLLATTGGLTLCVAGDLLTLFLGIEALSMASYVLAGFRRSAKTAQEAALKYYLFGAFASAFMVFGMALLWGEAGRVLGEPTFSLTGIGFAIGTGGLSALGWVGVALLLSGLLFKVGVAPFHAWVPDVYEGAPTSSAALFAGTVKFASFVALGRFLLATVRMAGEAHERLAGQAHGAGALGLLVLALASIGLGNLLALRQQHLKRFLAWSSVAHAGYALLGLTAACAQPHGVGVTATCFYLLTYCGMSLGAFGVLLALESPEEAGAELTLDRLQGALREHPLLAAVMALSLFAMAGLPPTAGFTGKFAILQACVAAGFGKAALLAALAGVLGAYGYLRVLGGLLLQEPSRPFVSHSSGWLTSALVLSAGAVLGLGLCPGPVWAWAQAALAPLAP